MRRALIIAGVVFLVFVIVTVASLAAMLRKGFSAHDEPTAMEALIARTVRHYSVPAALRSLENPVPLTAEVLAEARGHFADHCASCHANDGKGRTEMGQRFYPKVPDMTLPATQKLSDGEIFSIIENGIRLTGMPGWGDGTAESGYGSWTLVHLIRHLPRITPQELEEMARMNPVSPAEFREQQESEEFLEGDSGNGSGRNSP